MSKKELYSAVINNDVQAADNILTEDPELIKEIVLGKTWLNLAASKNNISIMRLLVEKGIPIDVDWGEEPPINSAADSGASDAVNWLIENGADVNGRKGITPPLVGAIHSGSIELVRLFLNKGANIGFTWGHLNYSPITFAKSFGSSHAEIVKLLENTPTSTKQLSVDRGDEVIDHLEKYYGKASSLSVRQIVSELPVELILLSRKEEPFKVLATSGVSKVPMNVPRGMENYKHIELMVALPTDWPLDENSVKDKKNSWPIEWLFKLAHHLHDNNTWIGGESATFSNENPPEPLAENTKLSCFLAYSHPGEAGELVKENGDLIKFYSLYPIYSEELKLQEENGTGFLVDKFQELQLPMFVDIKRRNVCNEYEV